MTEVDRTDRTSYAPFVLMDGKYRSLFLSDQFMGDRFAVFEALGWEGNGYDWNAVAQVVVTEQLPDLAGELTFDPEGGMFSAGGSRRRWSGWGRRWRRCLRMRLSCGI